ncbi:MAG TPA: hypothetical protein VFI73_00025 [Candidatus Nitrosopolaris sp.]|nr:hypothetical protein [Candidatus Nitrosopolaris sp.]
MYWLGMANFAELENTAEKYMKLKQQKKMNKESMDLEGELNNISIGIIGYFSSSEFAFPLDRQVVVSNGITTYVYKNNATYPNLFEFISELLHLPIPIAVEGAKFGPGEIIVTGNNTKTARRELDHCIIELQKLIIGKKS